MVRREMGSMVNLKGEERSKLKMLAVSEMLVEFQ